MQIKAQELQVLNSFSGPRVESSGLFHISIYFKLKNSIVFKAFTV